MKRRSVPFVALAALALGGCSLLFSYDSHDPMTAAVGGGSNGAQSAGGSGGGGSGGMGVAGAGAGGGGGLGGAGGGVVQLVDCGDEQCRVDAQSACCWDAYEQHGDPQAECVSGAIADDGCATDHDATGYETLIRCQRPSQCGGAMLCCAERETIGQQSFYVETSCQPGCDFPDIVLCEDASSSPRCPMLPTQNGSIQGVCQQSSLLPPGYLVCGYP